MKPKRFIAGKIVKDAIKQTMASSFLEFYPPFMWPEQYYAGNWVIDCDGQYQSSFLILPSVPKSWETIYGVRN